MNRHKRSAFAELTNILRPELNKAKASEASQSKDHPAHFFAAQCLHYGLAPSKTKATSKMRLLEALNKSQLIVPTNITTVEAEIEKKCVAAERKAKAAYTANASTSL